MTVIPCSLPHTVHLIIPRSKFVKAIEDYPHSLPPDREMIRRNLADLSASGVPTFVDADRRGEHRITFCTPLYQFVCALTQQEDAYYVYRLSPLTLRSHNQIVRQRVAVMARDWKIHEDVSDLNRFERAAGEPPQSGFKQIQAAWAKVSQATQRPQSEAPSLSSAHLAFLSDIETLIDLACQVELDKAASRGISPVDGPPEPVAQARLAGDVYRFNLAAPTDLGVGDYVRAGLGAPDEAGPGYTGVVTEVTDQALTVRFHRLTDLRQLQRVEWLTPWASTRQYDIQKAALAALREGSSRNPHALRVIVDGHFEDYQEQGLPPRTLDGFNVAQRKMIARAERVPDLLLALGPPGTGKTHTIRAITARQTAQDKKVLITSKNNKAVDNVLETLEGVDALRIGREEAISAKARKLMIDEKANELQAQILANITPTLSALDDLEALWQQIQAILSHLVQLAADWRLAQARYTREMQEFADWQRARYDDVARVIERQVRRLHAAQERVAQAARQANTVSQHMDRLSPLCQLPVVGAAFVMWSTKLDVQWKQEAKAYRRAVQEVGRTADHIRQTWDAYRYAVSASDEAVRRKFLIFETEEKLETLRTTSSREVGQLTTMLDRFEDVPSLDNPPRFGGGVQSPESLEDGRWQLHDWHQGLAARRALLHDWRDLLQTRHQALYPTLIQMADVVGATCIGVATDARFEDLAFDLMIADEAGQIQVMDLLVPLVRAKRAILVGDHLQLPPVVEDEVAKQIDPDEATQHAWLEQSLFEQLFERPTTPETHTVVLDTQYRMPETIASFISEQFYDGQYHTGRDVPHADRFFDGPMVFVDTMAIRDRRERPAIEPEGIRGYTNNLEARLIAEVALAYQAHSAEWGVIVPYKKQAERIREELRRRRPAFSTDFLQDWVATVDSFQGKQRDVIVYGFTRSNSRCRVGFMAELRRLNVSLTRARHQLVLIGDSTTLTRATDRPFADLMQALLDTVKSSTGGYMHARDLPRRLRR